MSAERHKWCVTMTSGCSVAMAYSMCLTSMATEIGMYQVDTLKLGPSRSPRGMRRNPSRPRTSPACTPETNATECPRRSSSAANPIRGKRNPGLLNEQNRKRTSSSALPCHPCALQAERPEADGLTVEHAVTNDRKVGRQEEVQDMTHGDAVAAIDQRPTERHCDCWITSEMPHELRNDVDHEHQQR